MAFHLPPKAEAQGYGLRAYDTIGSTNAEAFALARDGAPGPLWVVSSEQSAGRGRRGRPWATTRGNLAASLLLRTSAPAATVAALGFVAGLAVERALRACCGGKVPFSLKWPNDVLADGAKVGGILLETEGTAERDRPVVIGIGVNVRAAPVDVPYPAISLQALGYTVGAEAVFEELSEAWLGAAETWDQGRGFAAIRRAWLATASGVGGPIAVRSGAETWRGTFETIDERGQLVLLTEAGARRAVAAGDVHFGTAASERGGT